MLGPEGGQIARMCMAMNRVKLTPCAAAVVALLLAPWLAYAQPGRISIDLDTIADIQNLPDMLVARGYSPEDIAGVMNGNFVRFLNSAWA